MRERKFLSSLLSPTMIGLIIGTPIYAEDLNAARNDLAGTYYLTQNIDLSNYGEWVPIGYGVNSGEPFSGTFDG